MTKGHTPNSEGRIKVAVGIPSMGTWRMETGVSMAAMYYDFAMWKPEGVVQKQLMTLAPAASMLVQSRHDIVLKALRNDCTHVLFVDADMQFPKNMLRRLMRHEKDIVAVNCTTRALPVKHIAHDSEGKVVDSRKKHGLQKVQHVGLAAALIKTEVFKAMGPPIFMMEWIPEERAYCGEDVYFCAKAQAHGFDIWVDHDLSHEVLHVGKLTCGPGMIGAELPEPRMQ